LVGGLLAWRSAYPPSALLQSTSPSTGQRGDGDGPKVAPVVSPVVTGSPTEGIARDTKAAAASEPVAAPDAKAAPELKTSPSRTGLSARGRAAVSASVGGAPTAPTPTATPTVEPAASTVQDFDKVEGRGVRTHL
jgi:hypothetical protein